MLSSLIRCDVRQLARIKNISNINSPLARPIHNFGRYLWSGEYYDHIGRLRTIITFLWVSAVMPIYAITSNHNTLLWLGPLFGLFTAFFGLFGSRRSELFPNL